MYILKSIKKQWVAVLFITIILVSWQLAYSLNLIARFMLPSPILIVKALVQDFDLMMHHARVTLVEAFLGLTIGILIGFIFAFLMDNSKFFYRGFYPIIVLTQTVPTVAIAPLLVLCLGYGITPKVVLVVLTTFFPITIGVFNGFQAVDEDQIRLMKTMGASPWQIYKHVKIPNALPFFYSGLRISASYALIGAVVSEWLGGFQGLGVYMTRVRKSMSYDKMLAVIFLISLLSLILMGFVDLLQKKTQPWLYKGDDKS